MACLQDQTHNVKTHGSVHAAEFARAAKLVEKKDEKEQKDLAKLKAEAKRAKDSTTQASSAPEGAGNDLLQINAGPAALAMPMIFRAIGLYATIIDLQKEQRVAMVETQADSAEASAKAMEAEGKAAMDTAFVAGAAMLLGAGLSLGAMRFAGTDKTADEDLAKVNTRIKPMESVHENLNEPGVDTAGHGAAAAATHPTKEDAIQARVREFEQHNYSRAGEDPEVTKEAVKRLNAEWRKGFFERYDADRSEVLSITNRQTAASQRGSSAAQAANSIGSAGSSVAQGVGTMVQKKKSAESSLDQLASNLASNDQQQAAAAMKSADDAQKQEVTTLREIDRSNSVQV
jgi:hypothetical protein